MSNYTSNDVVNAIIVAAKTLDKRKEEINRLNVFPVPDGDTGANMSLTLATVVEHLSKLPAGATSVDRRHAITTGALMGARGNSGVITSQILRGFCEGFEGHDEFDVVAIDDAFASAVEVAFKAVRKPVEGTILTVLHDTAAAAKKARKKKMDLEEAMQFIVSESYASVQRTPELLPVLRENGVVDAGGFGLAIFIDSFVAALTGRSETVGEEFVTIPAEAPKVEIEQINDWEGSAYMYCNEFLVDSDTLNAEEALNFLSTMGDCELCVGSNPKFKVHVHSNHPDQVLAYFLQRGQISEVFIHNMKLQSEERTAKIEAEQTEEPKPIGFVAVAAGEGNARILESLGVDVVVSGGQTMNPSTKDLLDAVNKVNAESVIIFPNNSNIIMASQSCAEVSEKPCGIVPTKSVPESFSVMFAFDEDASLEENVAEMTEALEDVKTGEITYAIKDAKDAHGGPIHDGDVIGIADGSIEVVSNSIEKATINLLHVMDADFADTLTILAGCDYSDEDFDALVAQIEEEFEDLEIDANRGEQPLYPIILSVE